MSNDAKDQYTDDELARMDRDQLVTLGTNLDGVDVAYKRERYEQPGTKAEKRAVRGVVTWLIVAVIAAAAFFGIYIWWPWQYKGVGDSGELLYSLYTPLIGLTFGIAILALGIAAVKFTKKLIPEELSIQQRHDGPSPEVDRKTMAAQLQDSYEATGLGRRKMLKGTLGVTAAAVGIMAILPLGGFIKNPWKKHPMNNLGDGTLHTSGWTPHFPGEKIYLRRDTGNPHEVVLIKPGDMEAGGMETVFPFRQTDLEDSADQTSEQKLLQAMRGGRNPVMLIRFRSADAAKIRPRKGQVNFNYGDYYAYSKICTHLGCPTSLYEQQTNRILCPCHQSQFDALEYCKPIFGPAARALPQLPITVDENGYLVANGNTRDGGDFIEPLGPAFWERRS